MDVLAATSSQSLLKNNIPANGKGRSTVPPTDAAHPDWFHVAPMVDDISALMLEAEKIRDRVTLSSQSWAKAPSGTILYDRRGRWAGSAEKSGVHGRFSLEPFAVPLDFSPDGSDSDRQDTGTTINTYNLNMLVLINSRDR